MLGSVLKHLFDRRADALASRTSARPDAQPRSVPDGVPAAEANVFTIDWGLHGLLGLLTEYRFRTVLDIGSGSGEHARLFRHFGKEVFSVDLSRDADYVGDFLEVRFDRRFDVVWCSHVLEHQRNAGLFLEKLFDCIAPTGVLAISVPCHPRERLVPGHVTTWNAGLLCYNLILAGFDCSEARFIQTGDLSLLVRKRGAAGPDIGCAAASGLDLNRGSSFSALAKFFPFPVTTGVDAEVLECNWMPRPYALALPAGVAPFRIIGKLLPPEGVTIGVP